MGKAKTVTTSEALGTLEETLGLVEPSVPDEMVAPATVSRETPAQIKAASDAELRVMENKRRNLGIYYKNEKKIPVSISPMYIPYFGKSMAILVNGIRVSVPCNNEVYEIPETFAAECKKRIRNIDVMLQRQKKLSDVRTNGESYAGQLVL